MKFRLSTAIVMMLVAAVLLWLSMRGISYEVLYVKSVDYDGPTIEYGFPFAGCYVIQVEDGFLPPDNYFPGFTLRTWQPWGLGLDIAVFVATVLGSGFVMERFVLRTRPDGAIVNSQGCSEAKPLER